MKRIRDPQYLQLIKKETGKIRYWEAWVHAPKLIVVHVGIVGDIGKETDYVDQFWHSPHNEIEKLAKSSREQGYIPLTMRDLHWFLLQYEVANLTERQLLVLRKKVQHLIDQSLGWTGNGRCKGSNVSGNQLNFYCLAVDLQIAVKTLIKQFTKDKLLDNLAIGIRDKQENYLQVYPEKNNKILIK